MQAGLLPGPPILTATSDGAGAGGWRLTGISPWCTGWGMVDELLVAARLREDIATVAWFMVSATAQPGLRSQRLNLHAVGATETVALTFDGVTIDGSRFLGTDPFSTVGHAAGNGLRPNGSLALGLGQRCANGLAALGRAQAVAAADELTQRISQIREQLDTTTPDDMAAARASANQLAIQAATAFVAGSGAASAVAGSAAERAMREATFLLVFGSRPQIRTALLTPQTARR
ncbi:MAG: hypothetical protein R2706_08190 [Acidimicrobiales bacterium]